jgi:hypothetical protein
MTLRRRRLNREGMRLLFAIGLCVGACGGAGGAAGGGAGAGNDESPFADKRACRAPVGVSAAPNSIDDVVTLVNALFAERQEPVTLPCVVESLERPLGALAAVSMLSLQRAVGAESPRFFLFSGDLVLGVVPDGDGKNFLEMGTRVSETRSIKGEIEFPLRAPLAPGAPYDHVRQGDVTLCALCHGTERPSARITVTRAFESDVLRPLPSQEVDLAFVRRQSVECDAQKEPDRCALLAAIFGPGELEPREFSPNAPTIYDN